MSTEDKKTPLDLLRDEYGYTLSGLNTNRDSVLNVPENLKDALALINGVNREKLQEDLQSAIIPDGEKGAGTFEGSPIITPAKPAKGDKPEIPAQTVNSIINDAQAPYIAMADLLDKYIRLVIEERFGPETTG
jgi:hypothetical protein